MTMTKPHPCVTTPMIRAFLAFGLLGALIGCRSDQPGDAARAGSAARRPIIDMHMHAFTFETWSNGNRPPNPRTGKPPDAKTSTDILRLTLEAMDRYNIKIGVLSGRLETVYAWKAKAPDRFLAFALFSGRPASDPQALDPSPSLDSLRREYATGRLQGLGEITSAYEGVDFDGPELAPYFALAAELNMPVGVHTGLTFPGAVFTCCPQFRIERGNPVHLDEVLARNPSLRLYLMHMGDVWQESTLAILHMYPQVCIDVAAMDWGAIPREQFHANLQGLIRAGFGKRIMFGSDQMVWPELIGQAIEGIESAPFLSEEEKHDIFYNNAARVLGLPELPVPTRVKVRQEGESRPR
jgi:predicted TIM-barrel fold metal-dependent hydrolase